MVSIGGASRSTLYNNPLDDFRYGSVESLSIKEILELKREISLLQTEQQDVLEVLNSLLKKVDSINRHKE